MTPLHYAALSQSFNQADIAILLINGGAEVDALDEARRSPLHYASEMGKVAVIPVLIQNGAKISLRDGEKNLTALQLAGDSRVKDVIVMYSSVYKSKGQDLPSKQTQRQEMAKKHAASGVRIKKRTSRHTIQHKPEVETLSYNAKNNKELLQSLLGRVQEYGVSSYQHVKRPYLFSGSWMEQVRSVEDLMKTICGTTPSDAVMRVFNVLSPYSKPLPTPKGDELLISKFYKEKSINEPNNNITPDYITSLESEVKGSDAVVSELENELRAKNERLANMEDEVRRKDEQIRALEFELRGRDSRVAEMEAKLISAGNEARAAEEEREEAKGQVQELAEELQKAQGQVEELQEIVNEANEKYLEMKNQLEAPGNEEVDSLRREVEDLREKLQEQKDDDIVLRQKAGLLFLASLEDNKAGEPLVDKQFGDELDNFDPTDDYALIRLLKKLEGNPPSLYQRLLAADTSGRGTLSLSQYTAFLESLQIPPQDVMSMLCLAKAFDSASGKFRIADFMEHLKKRAELREKWEKGLFGRVLAYFEQSGLSLEEAFRFFDSDQNGLIEFEEMARGFNAMKIRLPRQDLKALFAVMDKDGNGTISIEEFEERLLAAGGNLKRKKSEPNLTEGEEKSEENKSEENKSEEPDLAEGLDNLIDAENVSHEGDIAIEKEKVGAEEKESEPDLVEGLDNMMAGEKSGENPADEDKKSESEEPDLVEGLDNMMGEAKSEERGDGGEEPEDKAEEPEDKTENEPSLVEGLDNIIGGLHSDENENEEGDKEDEEKKEDEDTKGNEKEDHGENEQKAEEKSVGSVGSELAGGLGNILAGEKSISIEEPHNESVKGDANKDLEDVLTEKKSVEDDEPDSLARSVHDDPLDNEDKKEEKSVEDDDEPDLADMLGDFVGGVKSEKSEECKSAKEDEGEHIVVDDEEQNKKKEDENAEEPKEEKANSEIDKKAENEVEDVKDEAEDGGRKEDEKKEEKEEDSDDESILAEAIGNIASKEDSANGEPAEKKEDEESEGEINLRDLL